MMQGQITPRISFAEMVRRDEAEKKYERPDLSEREAQFWHRRIDILQQMVFKMFIIAGVVHDKCQMSMDVLTSESWGIGDVQIKGIVAAVNYCISLAKWIQTMAKCAYGLSEEIRARLLPHCDRPDDGIRGWYEWNRMDVWFSDATQPCTCCHGVEMAISPESSHKYHIEYPHEP